MLGLFWKWHNGLLPSSYPKSYKSFLRPHLDYGGVIFDKAYNISFTKDLNLFNTRYHW